MTLLDEPSTLYAPAVGDAVRFAREGHLAPQDRGDHGLVVAVAGDQARVDWHSGITTWVAASELTRRERV